MDGVDKQGTVACKHRPCLLLMSGCETVIGNAQLQRSRQRKLATTSMPPRIPRGSKYPIDNYVLGTRAVITVLQGLGTFDI